MLTGTLDDFTLADVLRLIAGARRTGGLAVNRDGGAGHLYFRDGTVTSAVPGYERRSQPASPGGAIEDLTFDLMRWGRGDFAWTPAAAAPAGPELSCDVEELLRDVSRRLEELAEIQSLVPSEDAVPVMAAQPPEGAVQINITPGEWRVLVLVDGHRSVGEIAAATGLDALDAMKLLYGLASAGLVTAGTAAPPRAPRADDVVPPQTPSDTTDTTAVSDVSDTPPGEVSPGPAALVEPEPAPDPDPFLDELAMEPASPFGAMLPAPAEAYEAHAVDRSAAARELAGLFDDVDPTSALGGMAIAGPPSPPRAPRRVEDDDQVTRGLISRLIDGVKGL